MASKIVIVALCAAGLGQAPIVLGQQSGEITIEDPRPLAAVARVLEAQCRCAITYEDPTWTSDQVTPSAIARRRPDGSTSLVPKGIPLRLALSEGSGPRSRSGVLADLQSAMTRYNTTLHLGEFGLVDDGRMFHIRPDGPSALDVSLTISETRMTLGDALESLAALIGKSSGQEVVLAMAPANLSRQWMTQVVSSRESARDVLSRILDATGHRVSWQLLYDFETSRFFLSVYSLP
jgi:hypothetical protein